MNLATVALACRRAQELYLADVAASGRVATPWRSLDYQTRHTYVDRAVLELERPKVVPFTPRQRATVHHQHAAPVVAVISADAPWGHPA